MTSLIIGLITATFAGVVLLLFAIIRIAWNTGYTAGHLVGRADEVCQMAQVEDSIKKKLVKATNWSARDSLHGISDLED